MQTWSLDVAPTLHGVPLAISYQTQPPVVAHEQKRRRVPRSKKHSQQRSKKHSQETEVAQGSLRPREDGRRPLRSHRMGLGRGFGHSGVLRWGQEDLHEIRLCHPLHTSGCWCGPLLYYRHPLRAEVRQRSSEYENAILEAAYQERPSVPKQRLQRRNPYLYAVCWAYALDRQKSPTFLVVPWDADKFALMRVEDGRLFRVCKGGEVPPNHRF